MSKKILAKKMCPYCEMEFTPNHARRKFCCDSHRVNYFNRNKGFKVVKIPPEEREPSQSEGMKAFVDPQLAESESESKQKSNDFNAGSIGAATVGTMAGNKLYDVFTADHNKPATKGYVKQVINELFTAVETRNQQRHRDIIKQLNKKNNGVSALK